MIKQLNGFTIEKLNSGSGHCDCCGHESRWTAGLIYDGPAALAAYWMRWTKGHLSDIGANLDLVLGPWGDGTSANDRVAISLVHRQQSDGTPALMVVDATSKYETFASKALRRDDVIGTPLAGHVFEITDVIYLQDDRFF